MCANTQLPTSKTKPVNAPKQKLLLSVSKTAPVLLLHGFMQHASTWQCVAESLSKTRDVYALEFPTKPRVAHVLHWRRRCTSGVPITEVFELSSQAIGCDSEAGEQPVNNQCTLDAMSNACMHIAATLPQKPIVVGYSMGGRVAVNALVNSSAARFAHTCEALVLESAGLGPENESAQKRAAANSNAIATRLRTCASLAAFVDWWEGLPLFQTQQKLAHAVLQSVREERLNNNVDVLLNLVENAGQHCMPARSAVKCALQELASNNFFTSYITGALDKKYSAFARCLEQQSLTDVIIVPGVGHNVHLEAEEEFLKIIINACNYVT